MFEKCMLLSIGMEFMDTTWLTISIIIAVILLIILGYFYESSEDGPLIILEAILAIFAAAFWPVILIVAIGVLIITVPIYLGKKIKDGIKAKKKREKQKKRFMNKIEEIKKCSLSD